MKLSMLGSGYINNTPQKLWKLTLRKIVCVCKFPGHIGKNCKKMANHVGHLNLFNCALSDSSTTTATTILYSEGRCF